MAYWFNVDTKQVEQDGATDPKAHLLGPYETQQEAANALASAQERTDKWDAEDRDWNEGP